MGAFSEHLYNHYHEDDFDLYTTADEKLKKIKDLCERTIKHFNPDSGTNPYSAGRCMTAEQILEVFKDENN